MRHGRLHREKKVSKRWCRSPRNAQAIALHGFVFAANNRIDDALATFNQAIAADGSLGNAWLGRGLCRIRRGLNEQGRYDLLMATLLEPQRSILRSYLGKAFAYNDEDRLAPKEFDLARSLDSPDPTPWFYSALLLQQGNRNNEAIDHLEKSIERKGGRKGVTNGSIGTMRRLSAKIATNGFYFISSHRSFLIDHVIFETDFRTS